MVLGYAASRWLKTFGPRFALNRRFRAKLSDLWSERRPLGRSEALSSLTRFET